MNSKRRVFFALSMVCVMLLTTAIPAGAAKKLKLSSKKLTVTVGASKKLSVKNTKKKVKWSVKSGKKYISLKKKKKTSVTVQGKKKGKAVILAKIGKKKLTCKVTVKKAKDSEDSQTTVAPTENTAVSSVPAATGTPAVSKAPAATTKPTENSVPTASSTPAVTVEPTAAIEPTESPMATTGSTPAATAELTASSTPAVTVEPPATIEPTESPAATVEPTVSTTPIPTYAPEKFQYEGLDWDWIDANIDPEKPMVALTFDDGPVGNADTDTSMIIQNALKKYNAHATFFYIGGQINSEEREAEIKSALENGFEIGNHSWSWGSLTGLEPAEITESVEMTNAKLTELSGYSNFLFRAPNLAVDDTMKAYIRAPFIDCALDSQDWNGASTSRIIKAVSYTVDDGYIVLMHETQKNTAAAIETVLKNLTDQGYQVVSVSEMFAVKQKEMMTGTKYSNAK